MAATPITSLESPFVGLRPFEPLESALFHGRKQHTQQLLRLLAMHRFLGVIGTSGSGKSSLVKAGLIPALHRGYLRGATSRWKIAMMRPGEAPLNALAEALGIGDRARLERDSAALVDIARAIVEPGRENLLLVVDQFEELFRGGANAFPQTNRDAAYFIAMLLRARDDIDAPVYVVVTMRSEFLGDCAQYPGLAEALSEAQYLIPRLTRAQREEAIRGPLDLFGIEIEDALVQRLLNDAGDEPDQLPALQHALRMLARDRADAARLTLGQYTGDPRFHVGKSLDAHSESVYAALTERQQALAQRMFRCLTNTEEGRAVRRPQRLDAIYPITGAASDESRADVRAVVRAFASPEHSLLYSSTGNQLRDSTRVDLTHESLMRQWERLKKWVDEEAQSAAAFRRLVESAQLHRENRASLWRDPDASSTQQRLADDGWNEAWGNQYCPGFAEAVAFLDQSRAAIAVEEEEKRQAAEERLRAAEEVAGAKSRELLATKRTRNWLILGFAILAALVAALFLALQSQRRERERADRASALANHLRSEADIQAAKARAAEREAQAKTVEVQALQATGEEKKRLEKEAAAFRLERDNFEKQAKAEQGKLQSATDRAAGRFAELESEISMWKNRANGAEEELDAMRKDNADLREQVRRLARPASSPAVPSTPHELETLRKENADLPEQLRRAAPQQQTSQPPVAPAVVPSARSPKVNPKDGLKYVWINPGKFAMGCSQGDTECGSDEGKEPHEVEITRGFWIGQTEVTQVAYQKIMNKNPSSFQSADRPVERVSWQDANTFCKQVGLRLPTEAEWEYAARAGTSTAHYGELDQIAWYSRNSTYQTQPVATKYPNAWGLYDMLGNVWEWVADWYDSSYYHRKVSRDPRGPDRSPVNLRVVRGGSWINIPQYVRASFRDWSEPTVRGVNFGFRCAGELP